MKESTPMPDLAPLFQILRETTPEVIGRSDSELPEIHLEILEKFVSGSADSITIERVCSLLRARPDLRTWMAAKVKTRRDSSGSESDH